MNSLKRAILLAIPVAAALILAAMPEPSHGASVCKKVRGVTGKGCVKKKDLRNRAVDEAKLSKGVQQHLGERESFYVTLDGDGATKTIATHGPLTYFARCRVEFFDPTFDDRDTGQRGLVVDRVEIVVTSSEAPWFDEGESDNSGGSLSDPGNTLAAGREVVTHRRTVSSGNPLFDNDADEGATIGPGGHYMAIEGETLGLGLNIFGHDCTVVGNVFKISGDINGP